MLEIFTIIKEEDDLSLQNIVLSHEKVNLYLYLKIQILQLLTQITRTT